ncbi:DUF1993 domain-containing protein [Pigmentiphaga litoralis]|uniref:DUF1993 domain-containing protein n=1 Tax=Pigmentiphaga litoralis TaxID=516702 RepID=UPI003B438752
MALSLHTASVPVFVQMLDSLAAILAKAETYATSRNIEAPALLQARLFPDMLPLVRQVQIACDFARGVCARLAGAEVPSVPDTHASFAELRGLLASTRDYIQSLDPAAIDAGADRDIVLRPNTPKARQFQGAAYLLSYGLPQFFFHVTTAYDILRHNGLDIGKRDFMGTY